MKAVYDKASKETVKVMGKTEGSHNTRTETVPQQKHDHVQRACRLPRFALQTKADLTSSVQDKPPSLVQRVYRWKAGELRFYVHAEPAAALILAHSHSSKFGQFSGNCGLTIEISSID